MGLHFTMKNRKEKTEYIKTAVKSLEELCKLQKVNVVLYCFNISIVRKNNIYLECVLMDNNGEVTYHE